MSAHLRLLSAAHVSAPTPTSLHRLRGPPPSPPAARLRLLLRPPRLGGSQARFAGAVRCSGSASAPAVARVGEDSDAAAGIWEQVRDIVVFAGPALGLWICGPLMSLIDTMVIGQTSALQLAALGPGTVFCDYLSYIFMFLSVATSNMVATSLAKKDEELTQHQVSMLLFLALACGIGMFLFTKVFGTQVLTAFTGSGNYELISSANTYAQIRGFAWPAVLVGLVAQSASLGMKDSWGPLKALAAASVINGVGDIFLCSVCDYGIAGAAWATMVSQVVAAFMMMQNLSNKGFRAFSFTIPSVRELLQIFEIAAPVFVTMTSKVAFYALLTYSATSMGAITLAAHQVMINVLCMCTVWGEPLSQTAQSFMPELVYGANRNLTKARMLLKSLVIIGAITGLTLGVVGTLVPWLFPSVFTNDQRVIQQMHRVLAPYFSVLLVTPSIHSLEGTLLAGRDLRYLSQSMGVCFSIGTLLLMLRRL
ncbi:protein DETOXIFICATION 46, chloroplastic isoform X2 [Zea mays]|uniref:protein DETOXIFICATION 46, chloroplastic isoform X2 n=1 Tax=Zea mays TaxID=4577 RepID=UPI0004DEBCB4|nr:protein DETOXIFICATION 46, chloroplastic isoform X2 [Zea mays]|eukprot:XP_008645186.1 protein DETOXIFICATION 46, chloroplastic isoform X3 [Zea mays]